MCLLRSSVPGSELFGEIARVYGWKDIHGQAN